MTVCDIIIRLLTRPLRPVPCLLLLLSPLFLQNSVALAHPLSYTDAWVRVSDVVDVRLNIFLDDVLRHQSVEIPADSLLPTEIMLAAIARHGEFLRTQLHILDGDGRELTAAVKAEPSWQPQGKVVDVQADASLKLTWQLTFTSQSGNSFRSLCFLHHFTSEYLQQPGELRLHLQHRSTGRRFDSVIAPGRPHTVQFPAVAALSSGLAVNDPHMRLTIGQSGVILEFTSPVLLLDDVYPEALRLRYLRSQRETDSPALLTEERRRQVTAGVTAWMKTAVHLSLNDRNVTADDVHFEWIGPDQIGPAESDAPPDSNRDLPVFGSSIALRVLFRPTEAVGHARVAIDRMPGTFTELAAEIVTRSAQESLVIMPDPAAPQSWNLMWQRQEAESSSPGLTIRDSDPVTTVLVRPAARSLIAASVCGGILVILSFGLFRRGRRRNLAVVSCLSISLLSGILIPQETYRVRPKSFRGLVSSLLNHVYLTVADPGDQDVLAELQSVLWDDLTEDVYLATVRSFASDASEPLLIEVQSVLVDSVEFETLPASARHIEGLATWRVRGTVHHWGHTHVREQIQTGSLVLRKDGENWKIRSISPRGPITIHSPGKTPG